MSSFFGTILGGSKGTAAASSIGSTGSSLQSFSFEEIVEELQRRGYTVQQHESTLNLISDSAKDANVVNQEEPAQLTVEAKVFKVLEAIVNWEKLDRHRHDKDRKFNSLWSEILAFDWARTPRGYCCEANKSVKVGLSEYSKYEEPEASQILLIQHYDSERPGNYEKRNSWGQVPPVWAIAFSCEELKKLSESIVANVLTEGTLIHREPEGDDFDYSAEPWWSESHWLVEEGKLVGVRILSKCTQDKAPVTHNVRFKMRGSVFELIGVEKLKVAPAAPKEVQIPLPVAAPLILPPYSYLSSEPKSLPINWYDSEGAPKVEGNSLLMVRVCKGTSSTSNFEDRDKNLCQSLKSPVYAITNPSDTRVAITEFWVEFLQSSEEEAQWVRSPTRVGVETQNYYGQSYTEFVDVQTFEIASHSSVELVLEGTWTMNNAGRPAYNGRPHNQRVHELFPDPILARSTFKDDQGNTKTIYFGFANTPLEYIGTSYEELVTQSSASEGFGEEYQTEMCLCVENPLTLNKCIILVTTKKENPHHWFVRVQDDRRNLGGSYNQASPTYLRKMAFKACQNEAEKPNEVNIDLGGTSTCKLTGLMDYASGTVFALHGKISVEHNGEIIAEAEAYCKLDFVRVTDE